MSSNAARARPEPGHPGLTSLGRPNSIAAQFDFGDDQYEGRRLFAEVLGTFFLALTAVGAGMVNARFGGHAIPATAREVAPALMVMASILFMGTVSGAHLNPVVTAAFALRGDFPWKRVPAYVVAQFAGAVLATLLLWALIGRHGSAGLTLAGPAAGAVLAVGIAHILRGPGGGAQGRQAAQGTLGTRWLPGQGPDEPAGPTSR